jgi:hypothetical protein
MPAAMVVAGHNTWHHPQRIKGRSAV